MFADTAFQIFKGVNAVCPEIIESLSLIHICNVELDMECNDLFFWACKDTAAKFVYTFPDGREETLVIEY